MRLNRGRIDNANDEKINYRETTETMIVVVSTVITAMKDVQGDKMKRLFNSPPE